MIFKSQFVKVSIVGTLVASSLLNLAQPTFASGSEQNTASKDEIAAYGNTENPKNIIFMVGDGMGPSFNTAFRYFKDNPDTQEMEKTAFDDYLVGTQRTNPHDSKDNVTDSAAGATAFSSGHKTYNGAIGVDENKKTVETVLERAKKMGKSTGLVTTSEVTDATPAAYASHIDSRDKKDEIAKQFFENRIDDQHTVDVILGGGAKYFGSANDNIDKKFKKEGYDVVSNKEELEQADGDKVLGLFADKNMPLQIDAPDDDPRLADMQSAALDRLSQNDKGFFLMVEGASIDKAAHANDVTGVMSEMGGFEKAFDDAISYAKEHEDTLVVATADHSTGGLTIAKGKDYIWDASAIHNMKHSGQWMTEQIAEGKDIEETIQAGYNKSLPTQTVKAIRKEAKKLSKIKEDDERYDAQYQKLQDAIQKTINDESNTGWTTYGHTGEDVNTYAFGPQSEKFYGNIDNTDNAKNIFDIYNQE
ncbi:alkaline phosphatase [Staphylococcus felis]|uniref:alkaline phosphatase n=1 Tax=Staphylococcus felis TaxID=46127 RepID=UPI000E26E149|nr:alkaline phosphatase [Staphylococcus felis]REH86236.1 alkaline phosphatase [Staphylococcus felis]REH91930.1 alkaline phosphatase [Staphylococcus felis]